MWGHHGEEKKTATTTTNSKRKKKIRSPRLHARTHKVYTTSLTVWPFVCVALHVVIVVVLLRRLQFDLSSAQTKQAFSHFLQLFGSSTIHDSYTQTDRAYEAHEISSYRHTDGTHSIFVSFPLSRQPNDGGPIEFEIRRHRRRALPNGFTRHPNKSKMPFAAMDKCKKSSSNKCMFRV